MTRNREITVIPWKKEELTQLHFHCSTPGHNGVRLVEIPGNGLWCPLGCGPSIPAIRIIETSH
jgi:hypothetical protein